jgi:beta-mannosidase
VEREKEKWGESFRFVVNGVPIFAKGADWIPADSFPTRMTRERYADLLGSAAAANMNMVRVWGGGFYENEAFYDLCDELGLLVWQDFMFACLRYPGHDEFVGNFRREAINAIRRIRHRACLALWCGNNEMEMAWAGWGWLKHAPKAARRVYDRMFHHLLPAWVKAEDPDIAYWPSSPSSGGGFRDPNGQDKGDGHDWSGTARPRSPSTASTSTGS